MLKPFAAFSILAGVSMSTEAQTVALFAVSQPPPFHIDVGDDLTFVPGLTLEVLVTGGTGDYSYLWGPPEFLDDPSSQTPAVLGLVGTTLFTVQVTDIGLGCVLTDELLVDAGIGMSEAVEQAFMLYPNPSKDFVRIRGPVGLRRVRLNSLSGALILEQSELTSRELVLDLTSVPAGVYFLTIELASGRNSTHKLCRTSAP